MLSIMTSPMFRKPMYTELGEQAVLMPAGLHSLFVIRKKGLCCGILKNSSNRKFPVCLNIHLWMTKTKLEPGRNKDQSKRTSLIAKEIGTKIATEIQIQTGTEPKIGTERGIDRIRLLLIDCHVILCQHFPVLRSTNSPGERREARYRFSRSITKWLF